MFNILNFFRVIDEAVILPKRDKRGKRYRLVRFRNVEDERMLAMKLNNIFINKSKIYVNIPQFQRGR